MDSATAQPHVRFLPGGIGVTVPRGATVLEAARAAGVSLNAVCGGEGSCGKCRVVLSAGEVDCPPSSHLSEADRQRGYVLACTARVRGDVEVTVPEETRAAPGKILVTDDSARFGALASAWAPQPFARAPLVRKLFLPLTAPTMADPLPDHERVLAAVRRLTGIERIETDLAVLQALPGILRAGNYEVTVTLGARVAATQLMQVEAGDATGRAFGLAVDVGTTTVVVHLVDLHADRTMDIEAKYNSQMQWGEDYIARIMYGREHRAFDRLQGAVVADINELVGALAARNGVAADEIVAVVCAGNTAMLHFLLGLDAVRIQREPYVPTANHLPLIRAGEIGIRVNPRALLYALPSVGAYVGGDITAGVAAIRFDRLHDLSLYIDIGTNGEIVLGSREWMVCCSASAGPAFEGSGVRHGMRAARGAIEKLAISRDGTAQYRVIGGGAARGLCGSGLLDALAELLRAGIMDRSGALRAGGPNVRVGSDGLEFLVAPRVATGIEMDLVITQADIRNLIRSKAAIYASTRVLLESLNLPADAITQVFLAGGFGNYLDVRNAITIGMLPDLPAERIHFVGNGSVTGARLALGSEEALQTVDRLASQMTYFDLMQNARFMDEFVAANFLPHTHVEQFPSVCGELPV